MAKKKTSKKHDKHAPKKEGVKHDKHAPKEPAAAAETETE